jgi:hypothetical protein
MPSYRGGVGAIRPTREARLACWIEPTMEMHTIVQ